MIDSVRLEHLDYIQRFQEPVDNFITDLAAVKGRTYISLFRVTQTSQPIKLDTIPMEYVLAGLYGIGINPVFLLRNMEGVLSISIGAWDRDEKGLADKADQLRTLLKSIYSFFKTDKEEYSTVIFENNGISLGIPTAKLFLDPGEKSPYLMPIDKLLQALKTSKNWQTIVLAQAVGEITTNKYLNNTLIEERGVSRLMKDQQVPNPLAQNYLDLLEVSKKNIELAKEIGCWKTAVYLSGDGLNFRKLSGLWKAIFSGEDSLPEPIQSVPIPDFKTAVKEFNFPDTESTKGPGDYLHPSRYLSLLNSRQLSAYIHLPNFETPGFSIVRTPDFDSVQQLIDAKDDIFTLGEIFKGKELTTSPYSVKIKDLSRHCLICGTTGAGKTNTVFGILKEAHKKKINFLVIESAKAEYRSLRKDPELKDIQVFTLGNETVSPFRINPFEVQPGIPVSVHLDLLKSVFSASFGMWTPLPQVLEQCLHKIYEDRGWDLSFNTNSRLQPGMNSSLAFPTMSDLYDKIEVVVNGLGYDQKSRDDIKAALLTRVNSLRVGGKGNMLDTNQSFPMDLLLKKSSVLELEGIGDDDDKAFLIGIFFIFLVEYRRVRNKDEGAQHLLVIEEAHRLLKNVPANAPQEQGNPRGKAVEAFANLLSEIRAYGQGVIISDQIPVNLAPEIIKNTNLKIVHRIISKDDRDILAGSMAMEDEQSVYLSVLEKGEAVVFAEGDDRPLLIHIDKFLQTDKQEDSPPSPPSDEDIRQSVAGLAPYSQFRSLLLEENPGDGTDSMAASLAWEAAKGMQNVRMLKTDFIRWVTTITESTQPFGQLWEQLMGRIKPYLKDHTPQQLIIQYTIVGLCEWFAGKRGAQAGLYYTDVLELQKKLYDLAMARLTGKDIAASLQAFRECIFRINIRNADPFPYCSAICPKAEGGQQYCLYRHPVEEYIAINDEAVQLANWRNIQLGPDKDIPFRLATISLNLVSNLVLPVDETKELLGRLASCYALHMQQYNFQEYSDKIVPPTLAAIKQTQS